VPSTLSTARHRIVAVSDDAEVIREVEERLEVFGAEFIGLLADGGLLPGLIEAAPDLVVMDSSGDSVRDLRVISAVRRRAQQCRFILLVSREQLDHMRDMTRSRAIAYLGKPVLADELNALVERLLRVQRSPVNRREHSRFSLVLQTTCHVINPFNDSEGHAVAALVRDVSRDGISLLVRQLMPVPAIIKLVFHIPGQNAPVQVLVRSIACTLTQIPGAYRIGARFVGLLPAPLDAVIGRLNGAAPMDGDLFLGKSFRDAVEDWLKAHQEEAVTRAVIGSAPLGDLVNELCADVEESPVFQGVLAQVRASEG